MTTPPSFTELMDLASLRLRACVMAASDDFFAEKENLLKPGEAVFLPHEYTDRGKWMDGWESRRKRVVGHDWAIVRLGVPGIVRGVTVDTAFFRGNFPSHCSIEACAARLDAPLDELTSSATEWVEILPKSQLAGDSKNYFEIDARHAFSHVRLNIFPDGGVARLRVHGEAIPDFALLGGLRGELDLAAADHGAHVVTCSDMFFGERRNLIMPDRALNMGDGWETRRRRGPGFDWAIVKLAAKGELRRLLIDTHHFKGNFPDTCRVEVLDCSQLGEPSVEALTAENAAWRELLPRTKLQADTRHWYVGELLSTGPATHLRISVYPDGGVSRLRAYGTLDEDARRALGLRRLNALLPKRASEVLRATCAATRWVAAMEARRPFASSEALLAAADEEWRRMGEEDWLQAFAAHPKIGGGKAKAEASGQFHAWSAGEQARVSDASDATRAALAEVNRAYEEKLGFIYIVCATGKSAEEMLELARARLTNDRARELANAAEEQRKITQIRLGKMLDP